MSTEQARLIAERIAKRVSGDSGIQSNAPTASLRSEVSSELATMRAMLTQLQNRLVQIETKVRSDSSVTAAPSMPYITTPLRERPVPLTLTLVGWCQCLPSKSGTVWCGRGSSVRTRRLFEKEKTCTIEPGGKPCDHCAMCSSRGF